jgi:riboflavin transporter FmnP
LRQTSRRTVRLKANIDETLKENPMNIKSITAIVAFAALAIALNAVKIPAFYWPGMFYTLCDIPVVIAFLLFGLKIGLSVEAIHVLGQEIFFPMGPGAAVFYPMGFVTVLLMVYGIYLASKFLNRRKASNIMIGEKKKTIYQTASAAALRGGLMPIVDFFLLYHILLPLVLGRVIPDYLIIGLLPSFVAYNVTSALYVVPIACTVARRASRILEMEMRIPI